MVLSVISADVAPGKTEDARAWSKKLVELMKRKFGVEVQTLVPVASAGTGGLRRMMWTTRFDSFGAWSEFIEKELQDDERKALVQEAFEKKQYFLNSSRSLYRAL